MIYDTEDLEHLEPESVTVVDSCGNLAYTIFYPWSSLEYPYVKAAVLSAMFDQPCQLTCGEVGELFRGKFKIDFLLTLPSPLFHFQATSLGNSFRHPLLDRPLKNGIVLDLNTAEKESRQVAFEELEKNSTTTTTPAEDEDSNYIIPLRVIFPAEHVHRDTENPFAKFKKYNYFVLRTDNQSYHGHLDSDPPEIVGIYRDLEAGIFLTDQEDGELLLSTTTEAGTPITEDDVTNSLTTTTGDEDEQGTSSEEPLFGFTSSSTSKISFALTNMNDLSGTATTAITETTEAVTTPSAGQRKDPLVYVDKDKEKFRVRKKYRFGEDSVNYNPRNFDEVEVLRDEVKTFITELGQSEEKDTERRTVNEHYEIMLPWLDYNL